MFFSEGVIFYSNRAHKQREKRERERVGDEREREKARDMGKLCVEASVSIEFLHEEKKEESEKRFSIAIDY